MAKTYDELEAQIQALRKQQRAIKKAEQEKAKKEREEFERIRNAKVYDAVHGFLTQRGITDEMIMSMDETDLRSAIFTRPQPQQ